MCARMFEAVVEAWFSQRSRTGSSEDACFMAIDRDTALLATLMAGDTGWTTEWEAGKRAAKRLLGEAWRGTSGPAAARITVFERMSHAYIDWYKESCPTWQADANELIGVGGLTFSGVVIVGDTAIAAWVGVDEILHVRDGAVLTRSTPHSLLEEFRQTVKGDAQILADFPYRNIAARAVQPGLAVDIETLALGTLQRGDRIAIVDDFAAVGMHRDLSLSAKDVVHSLPTAFRRARALVATIA